MREVFAASYFTFVSLLMRETSEFESVMEKFEFKLKTVIDDRTQDDRDAPNLIT